MNSITFADFHVSHLSLAHTETEEMEMRPYSFNAERSDLTSLLHA